jgi:hypothetical protein
MTPSTTLAGLAVVAHPRNRDRTSKVAPAVLLGLATLCSMLLVVASVR